ncbi:glycosyltransferase [Prosthecomicrobium sp. N25]|uniref:glycosyltransferase n=1 Tax=Prosthecomicrobium sp. N25 TaxID=3129254 RepID=UPI003077613D
MTGPGPRRIVVVLKGYPRLSETFVAQELLGLERSGFDLAIVALRRPTDKLVHPVHKEIRAPVLYLPEYLHDEPLRVLGALMRALARPGFRRALGRFLTDLRHDFTLNRIRRFGQALVLAAEWPAGGDWIYAHFIHTPASVAAYASDLVGVPWSCSAHARDIWTSGKADLAGKLGHARWVVTCTRAGLDRLRELTGRPQAVHLSYHGFDFARFPPFAGRRPPRDGTDPADPVLILSVGRAVAKKGYGVLLDALTRLPAATAWRMIHVGSGEELADLKRRAEALGIAPRIEWRGALAQEEVLRLYRQADLFTLACRVAEDGDRDGLPNVLMEASSQRLVSVTTNVSGIPELLADGVTGLIVPPDDPAALAAALAAAIADPALRARLGAAAEERVRRAFDHSRSIADIAGLFRETAGAGA